MLACCHGFDHSHLDVVLGGVALFDGEACGFIQIFKINLCRTFVKVKKNFPVGKGKDGCAFFLFFGGIFYHGKQNFGVVTGGGEVDAGGLLAEFYITPSSRKPTKKGGDEDIVDKGLHQMPAVGGVVGPSAGVFPFGDVYGDVF